MKIRIPKSKAIVDQFNLPKDICLGAMKVTLTGKYEAWIENYRGILDYTDTLIRLQGKDNKVEITGTKLAIKYYSGQDMRVEGDIFRIQFV